MGIRKPKVYVVSIIMFFSVLACGSVDPSADEAKVLAFENLSGNWTFGTDGSISVDGQDVSLNFEGLALSFTDGGYGTTNAGQLFAASGTWEWGDSEARTVNLDDGKIITISTLTTTRFVFTFSVFADRPVVNSGNSIKGSYLISLNK